MVLLGNEEVPVRIIPQIDWNEKGILSPDGKLAATIVVNTLRIVDIERLKLTCLTVFDRGRIECCSFSPDGRYLAACTPNDGILIDLKSYSIRKLKLLAGSAVAFSSDSKYIIIGTSDFGYRNRGKPHLRIIDFNGIEKQKYTLDMVIPRLITCEGEEVIVTGIGGSPDTVIAHTFQVIQRINVLTGESAVQIDRTKTGREFKTYSRFPFPTQDMEMMGKSHSQLDHPKAESEISEYSPFTDLPNPKGKHRQEYTDIFWDEASGIAVLRGKGLPEGGVLKAWNIYEGRFISTLGTMNEVSEPIGFVRSGIFLAKSWFERSEIDPKLLKKITPVSQWVSNRVEFLTDFDIAMGERHPTDDTYKTKKPYPYGQHFNEQVTLRHGIKSLRIANGKLALNPDEETMRFHLVTIPEEDVLLTFITFEEDQWMIHTADGYWDGSNDILKNVAFYKGSKLLTESEIKELKKRDEIETLLRQYLPAKENTQSRA